MDNAIGHFDLHIDQGLGMGYIRHRGKTCLKNLNESLIQMGRDPRFRSVTRGISDFRHASGVLTYDEIRSHVMFVSRFVPRDRKFRWAILAQTNLAYGLARMFDILSENEDMNVEVNVFKDSHEAKVWLGIREKRHAI